MNDITKGAKEATYKFERGNMGKTIGGTALGAFILFILYFLILGSAMANKPYFMYVSDLITMSIIFIPFIVLLLYLALNAYRSQSDYIIVSPKGIEIKTHDIAFEFSHQVHDTFSWDQIANYALHKVYSGKGNYISYLVIQLRGEDTLRKYNVSKFDNEGKAITECATQYLEPTMFWNRLHTDLRFGYNLTWREIAFLAGCIPGGIMLAYTTRFYDKTFIPFWWWMPVIVIMMVIATVTRPKSIANRPGHYAFFGMVGAIICWLFISANYHFASWDIPRETKRYEILRKDHYKRKGKHKYEVTIKYNNSIKCFSINKERINEFRSAKVIEFDLHKGLFGYDVYKEPKLY